MLVNMKISELTVTSSQIRQQVTYSATWKSDESTIKGTFTPGCGNIKPNTVATVSESKVHQLCFVVRGSFVLVPALGRRFTQNGRFCDESPWQPIPHLHPMRVLNLKNPASHSGAPYSTRPPVATATDSTVISLWRSSTCTVLSQNVDRCQWLPVHARGEGTNACGLYLASDRFFFH
jgi:hypothetical protein